MVLHTIIYIHIYNNGFEIYIYYIYIYILLKYFFHQMAIFFIKACLIHTIKCTIKDFVNKYCPGVELNICFKNIYITFFIFQYFWLTSHHHCCYIFYNVYYLFKFFFFLKIHHMIHFLYKEIEEKNKKSFCKQITRIFKILNICSLTILSPLTTLFLSVYFLSRE